MNIVRSSDLDAILSGDASGDPAGDPGASRTLRAFVLELTPIVRMHTTRALFRHRAQARRRDVQQEIADMVQEVFSALFEENGKTLRAWSPERGLSFSSFIGLVTERQVAAILRSGRKSPWKDDATEPDQLEAHLPQGRHPETRIAQDQLARTVIERVAHQLSPRGKEFLRVLFLEEIPVDDVVSQLRVSSDVVYAWRTRIVKRARRIAQGLETNFAHAVRFREVAHKKGGKGQDHAMIGLSRDVAAQLEMWPALLCAVAERLSAEQARRAAPRNGFAMVEHVWHLADLEQEGFALRITRILEEDFPHLPNFDGDAEAKVRRYRDRHLDDAVIAFAAARASNVRRLGGVRPEEWARAGVLEGVGSVTLADLVCRMIEHDRSHAAELLELLSSIDAAHAAMPPLVEMARAATPSPCAA